MVEYVRIGYGRIESKGVIGSRTTTSLDRTKHPGLFSWCFHVSRLDEDVWLPVPSVFSLHTCPRTLALHRASLAMLKHPNFQHLPSQVERQLLHWADQAQPHYRQQIKNMLHVAGLDKLYVGKQSPPRWWGLGRRLKAIWAGLFDPNYKWLNPRRLLLSLATLGYPNRLIYILRPPQHQSCATAAAYYSSSSTLPPPSVSASIHPMSICYLKWSHMSWDD